MTRPCKPWGSIPNIGLTEYKHHYDYFINIGHALNTALDNAIADPFKPLQQVGNYDFGDHTALEILDKLFHT